MRDALPFVRAVMETETFSSACVILVLVFPVEWASNFFEPFFSTKAEGTGMGLAISRSIINAHGGTLSGENCDDGGACFIVRLPQGKEDKSKTVYPIHGGPAELKEITGKAPTVL